MSDITHEFFSISIENENAIIRIVPTQFYNVDIATRYVVSYTLLFIHKKEPSENRESIIPFYISNGQTNKIRANMLYPFMCYSDWDNQGLCPFYERKSDKIKNKSRRSLLIKYNIGPNYKYSQLEKKIVESFIEMEGPEGVDKKRKELQKMEKLSKKSTVGLPSVLPRLTNLLDLILCIMNQNIIHFNPQEINIRCFRPLKDRNDPEYINMQKCDLESEGLTEEDDYRFILISIFKKYAHLILKNHIFEHFEPIHLTSQSITKEAFNVNIGACDATPIIHNLAHYGSISSDFKDLFIEKIDRLASRVNRSAMTPDEEDIIYFASIMHTFLRPRSYYAIYSDHLLAYGMDCSKPASEGEH